MNESNEIEIKNIAPSNLRMAIVLAVIALIVGVMPFFYLKNMVIPN